MRVKLDSNSTAKPVALKIPDQIGIWKCWFLRIRGKPLCAGKRTNNKLNPHDNAESRDSNPGNVVGRWVLSTLCHPYSHPCCFLFVFFSTCKKCHSHIFECFCFHSFEQIMALITIIQALCCTSQKSMRLLMWLWWNFITLRQERESQSWTHISHTLATEFYVGSELETTWRREANWESWLGDVHVS